MSQAFVKEDDHEKEPEFRLPDPGTAYYDEAASWALIQGADEGNTKGAEVATGYVWGDPLLTKPMAMILEQAEADGQDRVAQLARRYLKAAAR